jgi:hypothetical protein
VVEELLASNNTWIAPSGDGMEKNDALLTGSHWLEPLPSIILEDLRNHSSLPFFKKRNSCSYLHCSLGTIISEVVRWLLIVQSTVAV